MQDTRIYDYMIRSGTVKCRWASGEFSLPLRMNDCKSDLKSEAVAFCRLSTPAGGLRAQVFIDNNLGLPLSIESVDINTTVSLTSNTEVFCNGYQSWSLSEMKTMGKGFKSPSFLCPALYKKSGDYLFTNYSENLLHSWTYTYFDSDLGFTLFASLDETKAYTRFKYYKKHSRDIIGLKIEKDCEGLVLPVVPRTSKEQIAPVKVADIFITSGHELDCIERYFDLFYKTSRPEIFNRSKRALAWDSWYFAYDGVEEERLGKVLEDYNLLKIPLDYFIIGQGYEKAVGDWTSPDPDRFSGGLKRMCDVIKSSGYKPGIALSPFICSSKSTLFKERKELLARDDCNNFISVGKSRDLGGKLYLLDLYNHESVMYIQRLMRHFISDYGFEVLKLDFLYAAGLNSGYEKGRTRAEAVYHGLMLLRKYSPGKILIGSGVPTGSCMGLFEHVSVAPELSADWEGRSFFPCKSGIRERESTHNALRTVIGRRHLDAKAFGSDTCVFSLRKYATGLNPEQREALFKSSIIFGSLITGCDSIGSYNSLLLKKYLQAVDYKGKGKDDKGVVSVKREEDGVLVEYVLKNKLKKDFLPGIKI